MCQVLLLFMFDSPVQIMLVVAAVFLLFGSTKLPQFAKSLGQTRKAFKEGMREAEDEERMEAAARQELPNNVAALPTVSTITDEELMAEMRRRAEAKTL